MPKGVRVRVPPRAPILAWTNWKSHSAFRHWENIVWGFESPRWYQRIDINRLTLYNVSLVVQCPRGGMVGRKLLTTSILNSIIGNSSALKFAAQVMER